MFPKSYFIIIASAIVSQLIPLISSAQLPFTQHPDPPGVTAGNARMNDLVIDAANNKWIAFGNYGVGIYDGTNWTLYNTTNSGMPSDSATSIAFDLLGNTWIGTNAGLVYKSGSTFTVFNTGNSGMLSNVVTSLLTDGTKTWIGTNNGLASYDGTNWVIYQTGNSGLVNDSITSLDVDPSGRLWIGTRNGLNSFDGTTWNSFTTGNSPLDHYIIDVACDAFGRTWVSNGVWNFNQSITTSGVHFVQNGVVKDFRQDLYFYDIPVNYPNRLCFAKDQSSSSIYFRSTLHNQGLIKMGNNSFEFFPLPAINLGIQTLGNLFQADQSGFLWTVPCRAFNFYSLNPAGYIPQLEMFTYENHRAIDINDVNAGINVMGDMHWDLVGPRYEVPKGSGKNSVFASALWIGGLDQGGQVHMAGQTYRQTGSDYWPGPISGLSVPFDTSSSIQFNKIWKIDKWKIEEFKNEFAAGNVTNGTYQVPSEIATWPAKGNGIVIDNMAPYVDFNTNGTYNPIDGDYPLIKGDQMLYYIFNDSLGNHTGAAGPSLGIEVHASVYAFNCTGINDSNQVLNWTTFYHYDILNRSINDYDSVSMGLWTDVDLGFYGDDLVGCDTSLSSVFVYDGDNDDGTYGINPPMQNIKVLRGTPADIGDGIDNDVDGTIDEPGEYTSMNSFMEYDNVNNIPTGNPSGAWDYYNLINATWLDGSPLTYGGNGYNSSNIITNFMFSGVPFSGSGWTELSAGNTPDDRRFIMGSGPFALDAGDTATFDFAYVFTWDSLSPNGLLTSIARNQADLQRVQTWFENNSFPSCEIYSVGLSESANELNQISVHPNPATDQLFVHSTAGSLYGMNYTILNLLGEEIVHGKINSNQINIAALPSQVYLLKIDLKSGSEYVRFVKW